MQFLFLPLLSVLISRARSYCPSWLLPRRTGKCIIGLYENGSLLLLHCHSHLNIIILVGCPTSSSMSQRFCIALFPYSTNLWVHRMCNSSLSILTILPSSPYYWQSDYVLNSLFMLAGGQDDSTLPGRTHRGPRCGRQVFREPSTGSMWSSYDVKLGDGFILKLALHPNPYTNNCFWWTRNQWCCRGSSTILSYFVPIVVNS